MINVTKLLCQLDNNHKGMQLLLQHFYEDYNDAALHVESLCQQSRYEELNGYSAKLTNILTLLCDDDLPPKMRKLEHFSKFNFPAPITFIEDLKAEFDNVNAQIQCLQSTKDQKRWRQQR